MKVMERKKKLTDKQKKETNETKNSITTGRMIFIEYCAKLAR